MSKKALEDGSFVAMTHHICPCCGKKTGEEVVLSTIFKDISAIHNKAVGWELCEECKENMKIAVMAVVLDRDKSGDGSINEWYRTGNIIGMSEDWCRRYFEGEILEQMLKTRMFPIDYRDAIAMRMPVKYDPK